MLAVPPPRLGTEGDVETVKVVVLVKSFPWFSLRNTVFGSVSMAWVIVPCWMNFVRSGGSLNLSEADAVWLGKGCLLLGWPMKKGVMSTESIFGAVLVMEMGARA